MRVIFYADLPMQSSRRQYVPKPIILIDDRNRHRILQVLHNQSQVKSLLRRIPASSSSFLRSNRRSLTSGGEHEFQIIASSISQYPGSLLASFLHLFASGVLLRASVAPLLRHTTSLLQPTCQIINCGFLHDTSHKSSTFEAPAKLKQFDMDHATFTLPERIADT